STIDTQLQLAAARAVRTGLEAYDRRHAWRGPVKAGNASGNIPQQLHEAAPPPALANWTRAMVTARAANGVPVTRENGATGMLVDADAQWAAQGARGHADRALNPGAIIYTIRGTNGRYTLKQIPNLQGALVAMDPHTGRVLAMVGGYSFEANHGLNRATQ